MWQHLRSESEREVDQKVIDVQQVLRESIRDFGLRSSIDTYVRSLTQVTARAIEVLGNREKALRWLETPIASLDNKPPIAILDREEGVSRVETLLGQIEHGVW